MHPFKKLTRKLFFALWFAVLFALASVQATCRTSCRVFAEKGRATVRAVYAVDTSWAKPSRTSHWGYHHALGGHRGSHMPCLATASSPSFLGNTPKAVFLQSKGQYTLPVRQAYKRFSHNEEAEDGLFFRRRWLLLGGLLAGGLAWRKAHVKNAQRKHQEEILEDFLNVFKNKRHFRELGRGDQAAELLQEVAKVKKQRRCCTNIPAPSSTSWLPTFYNATDTGIPIADILFSA